MLILVFAGCGFKPIYKTTEGSPNPETYAITFLNDPGYLIKNKITKVYKNSPSLQLQTLCNHQRVIKLHHRQFPLDQLFLYHLEECKHFGSKVLPNIKTCSLPHEYGRIPINTPSTPLGLGERH